MSPFASNTTTVSLTLLGAGQVVPSTSSIINEALLGVEPRVAGPLLVESRNVRLLDAVASLRSGYTLLATLPDGNRVTGLFTAVFDDGSVFTIAATRANVYTYDGTTVTSITGGAVLTATDDDYWTFAMAPRIGATPKLQVVMCSGAAGDNVYRWDPSLATMAVVAAAPLGTRVLVSHNSRCYAMNVVEGGARHAIRVRRSVVGDSTDWTGLGSGFVDLDGDPYPIAAATAHGGAMLILKGDATGGALYRAIPTGIVTDPDAYESLNPSVNAPTGLLLRRSVLQLGDSTVFFVGHDGFYFASFAGGTRRLASPQVRGILARINQSGLDAAVAWYKPRTAEIHLAIPTAGLKVGKEVWVLNVVDERVYGPYAYAASITAALSSYIRLGSLTWTSFTYPGGWGDIPYPTWASIGGERSSATVLLGTSISTLVNDNDDVTTGDAGATIVGAVTLGPIRLDGRARADGRTWSVVDLATLHDIILDYPAGASWTPVVAVSVDNGATFDTISDGSATDVGGGELRQKSYTALATGRSFLVRVSGDGAYRLHGVHVVLGPGGDVRHG